MYSSCRFVGLIALLSLPSLAALHAAEPQRPNILFIMADDLGWRDLGCFGSKFNQTPNLDKLAARGVKFTQAYAANPLCSPTRSSVLTGMKGKTAAPFLGLVAGKFSGPTVVKLRARSATGGAGKVKWVPSAQASDQASAKSVPFQLAGGDWQEVTVELPARGALGIVRLYLPAQKEPVQLDWVELKSAQGKLQR